VLCAGVDNFQADARRLRLFAFEVFFLGTAMAESWIELVEHPAGAPGTERTG
jgi:hypothetical protein